MSGEIGVLYAEGDDATARARFEELRRIPPGWDGDEAVPPTPATLAFAERWLDTLFASVQGLGTPWIKPHISVNPDGDVTLEWWNGERQMIVYTAGEAMEFIRGDKCGGRVEMASGTLASEADSRALWAWLAGIPSP